MSNILIPGRFVVCAACRDPKTGFIAAGARHMDGVMHPQMKMYYQRPDIDMNAVRWDQGFIDQNGVFMDRKEALLVAHHAGQLDTRRKKTSPLDRLFSEDLY